MTDRQDDSSAVMDGVSSFELAVAKHAMFDRAIESLELLHARAKHRRNGRRMTARGMLLLGASGAGKSTIVQHFLKTHPPFDSGDGMVTPVTVVEIPPAPTLRAVTDALYSSLGYRAEKALSAEDIVRDLTGKVDLLGVATMLLDEAHHIFDSRQSGDVTEFFKSLLNRLGCSMVFSGLDGLSALRASSQLDRRLHPDVILRPYNFGNIPERLEFMTFLSRLEQNAIDLPEPSNLAEQDTARRLYTASGGLIGIVTKYLSQALLLAKMRGLRRIDLDLLAEVDSSWAAVKVVPDDIGFDADIPEDFGDDVEKLLAQASRLRLDANDNPFACEADKLLEILGKRRVRQVTAPSHRRPDGRMKGTGPDSPRAFG